MDSLTITPRQLRELLFSIQSQDMTIAYLRWLLFTSDEQDTIYVPTDMARHIDELEKINRKAQS